MPMHADVDMDPHEAGEERLRKKRKYSNGDPLCHPQLNGWYTMHVLKNRLGEVTAKSVASTAPKRFDAQGQEQFLIADGEDALKQFYGPPPRGYTGRQG